jgi:hypothetical protein
MADEKELKDQRVPIMMTPSELEAIDDWMFKNRIRSRGEAIRRLCQLGLIIEDQVTPLTLEFVDIHEHFPIQIDAILKRHKGSKDFKSSEPLRDTMMLVRDTNRKHAVLRNRLLTLLKKMQPFKENYDFLEARAQSSTVEMKEPWPKDIPDDTE